MVLMQNSLWLLALATFGSVDPVGYSPLPVMGRPSQTAESQGGKSAGAPGAAGGSIVIHLEQKKGDATLAMRSNHVFDSGDVVRFRVTSGFDGYLYVIDLGSSGSYTTLFPAGGTGGVNSIQSGKDALVPSLEDGWFQIDGPAGFDVLYFLVSPKPLDVTAANGVNGGGAGPSLPNSLKPRCNDDIFLARGECIDDSAGPARLTRDVILPPQISLAARNVSRDIVFDSGEDDKAVKATAPSDIPVVYIFRLAHH